MCLVALKRACWDGWWESGLYLGLGLLGLLGEEDSLDVGQDTSLGDGDTGQQLVQLLVVTDGQLEKERKLKKVNESERELSDCFDLGTDHYLWLFSQFDGYGV